MFGLIIYAAFWHPRNEFSIVLLIFFVYFDHYALPLQRIRAD